jgi:hypothetical protein
MTINAQFSFDARDEELRAQGLSIWATVITPRIGDFVQLPSGTIARISLLTKSQFQVSDPRFGSSYHWLWWYCSYSGGHRPVLYERAHLSDTGRVQDGDAWVFHHDQAGAHRGVGCTIPCRIYHLATPI